MPHPARLGPPFKPWDSLGPHQKRMQSQKVFDELKRTATARDIDPGRLTGTLLHRYLMRTLFGNEQRIVVIKNNFHFK